MKLHLHRKLYRFQFFVVYMLTNYPPLSPAKLICLKVSHIFLMSYLCKAAASLNL